MREEEEEEELAAEKGCCWGASVLLKHDNVSNVQAITAAASGCYISGLAGLRKLQLRLPNGTLAKGIWRQCVNS